MPTELFAAVPPVLVTSGGSTCPPAGTVETWTVSANTPPYPSASSSASSLFHVQDVRPGLNAEYIAVINAAGGTWTVVRGSEGTAPVGHGGSGGFTVQPVIPPGFLTSSQDAITASRMTLRATAV